MAPQYSLCQFSVSWRHNILYISFPVKYFLFDSSQVKRSLTCSIKSVVKKKKKIYGPFLWMGFNCLKATDESPRGDSLLFTTHYPGVPGGHLIDLGRMKGWIDLGATQWFWACDPLCITFNGSHFFKWKPLFLLISWYSKIN